MYKNIGLLILVTSLAACVTINIYFPAAAAEKAADKIIDEVWQLKDGKKVPATAPVDNSTDTPTEIPVDTPAEVPAK
jgi:hypothetical protein